MSFGWSATDVVQLIVICHSVVANCRIGPSSAVFHLHALKVEVQGFESLLTRLHDVVKNGEGTPFLDLETIEQTLKECKDHLQKYNAIQHMHNSGQKNGQQSQISRSKDIFLKTKNAAKLGGEIVRHLAWGEKELQALQEKVAHHKQTLQLYFTILQRDKTSQIGQRLQSMERMVHEIHAESTLHTRLNPLARTQSIQISTDHCDDEPHDRYQTMLEAVERQRDFALLERSLADNRDDREWDSICDQLDLFHRRLLNSIERKASSYAQQRETHSHLPIQLNKALLSHTAGHFPFSNDPSNSKSAYDGFDAPTSRFHEVSHSELRAESTASAITDLDSPVPSIFSFRKRSSTCSMVAATEPVDPLSSSPLFTEDSYDFRSHLRNSDNTPDYLSLAPATAYERRDTLSSNGSVANHSTWKRLAMRGRIQIAWDTHPTPVPCYLEAGYRSDGRLYAIKAVDMMDSRALLPILRLSSTEKRPIPHSEPFDNYDEGYDAGRIFFITPPITKNGNSPQYVIEKRDDHLEIQSLIYGKRLLLSIPIVKLSSAHGKESDRQYLRLWNSSGEGDTGKSLLYFAPFRKHPRYIEIHEKDINPGFKRTSRSVLELRLSNSLQYLKLGFAAPSDNYRLISYIGNKSG
ncbi:hypothetical protein LOZ53_002744 [Ophidiomyces ophidiicola]|nr:hypothetical protein LOZ55_004982 [Ophidiomyces ophidiicola]KAI1986797.1 hypothetical protein LOZ51_005958 [Ophidiomyces ophidiicola]KAI1991671.1 hypothetical protein LOZ53_002744 [Ophidiomyces ophidiicola]KAI1996379.1 hypothetical protein LOZ54_000252 [Ophidiomyces ophidiicola]